MKKYRRLSVSGLVILFLTLLAGCRSVALPELQIADERWQEADCRFDVPNSATVGEDVICGTVVVLEQHAAPDGPTIELSVAIVRSTGDSPAPDPLVMFTGGPGGNIFDLAALALSPGKNPIRADRDLVFMSERGTYGSIPFLDCPELAVVDEHFGAPEKERHALTFEAYSACRERLVSEGANLNAYNNIERTADVPYVMDILGYEQYNLWGVSGGGLLTQLVVRDYPEGVRTIMTDSGAFPQGHMSEVFVPLYTNMSASFRLLFEDCAADPACNRQYPELERVFFDLVADLNANPVPVMIENPASGVETEVLLTGDLFIQTVGNLFAAANYLPKVIYDTSNGDYTFMAGVLPGSFTGDTGLATADGLYQSVFCPEVSHLTIEDLPVEGAYPEVVAALTPFIQNNLDICAMWGVKPIAADEVISSDVPALLMEGAYDSNKPPELGAEVAENFSTSYFVLMGDKAHVVLSSCAIDMMAEFMNDPMTAPDTSCVEAAPSFIPPAGPIWGLVVDNLLLVIGGVVILGMVIVSIFWLMRRRKKRRIAGES